MTNSYDPVEDLRKVTNTQKKWRDVFSGTALDGRKWTNVVGAGGAITVASATGLTLASGVTVNSETFVLSTETFTVPFRVSVGLTLSQRIINQSFFVEAVSVDRETGAMDGQHMFGALFDGTNALAFKYEVQASGLARLTSGGAAIPTTAGGSVYELESTIDDVWFHAGVLDATTMNSVSYRRQQQIPDPSALYRVRLRWLNGAVAPASNTNAVFRYITVHDYAGMNSEVVPSNIINSGAFSTFVQGAVPRNSGMESRPLYVATSRTTNSAVTADRVVDLMATLLGAIITKPYSIPEADWAFVSAFAGIATGVDGVIRPAVADNRQYMTHMQLQNRGTAVTEFQVKDGAAVIWRVSLPAAMVTPQSFDFAIPLRASTNTALNVQAVTANSAVVVNIQGYQAP